MPPINEQGKAPEAAIPKAETTPAVTPEAAPKSELPAEPVKEVFQDQPASTPPVILPDPVAEPDLPKEPTPPKEAPDADEKDTGKMDEQWVEAVDQVIEKTENKPYEEEEEAESLQVKYLFKRFKKILKRNKED